MREGVVAHTFDEKQCEKAGRMAEENDAQCSADATA
jgi:hypothetical protein